MRAISGALILLLLPAALQAQRPTPEGAWEACKAWVQKRLYQPVELRFPELGSAAVEVQTTGERLRPDYRIQSVAVLSGQGGGGERLPFSCFIQYRVTAHDMGLAYVWKRLVLPDSTVTLPRAEGSPGRGAR